MSYSILIGNAVIGYEIEDDEIRATVTVEPQQHETAPTFPNDEMTGNSNGRHPSYSGWADFCRAAELYEFFHDKERGLMRSHPGAVMMGMVHVEAVRAALKRHRKTSTLPPGFAGMKFTDHGIELPDDGKYDPVLARLIWLEYWMTWAVENCRLPALQNY